jgi:hypothetical protein
MSYNRIPKEIRKRKRKETEIEEDPAKDGITTAFEVEIISTACNGKRRMISPLPKNKFRGPSPQPNYTD